MYNRYSPRADGTFQRDRMAEPLSPESRREPSGPEPSPLPCPPPSGPSPAMGLGNFFRQLLPKGFDTGDLIVVLLLLLMAADGKEDQNDALLTLALYLFL